MAAFSRRWFTECPLCGPGLTPAQPWPHASTAGRADRADALLETMGANARPFWGRVFYHLLVSELDEAANWYEQMIDERDPFALLYARVATVAPLRAHHRWGRLAELPD